MEILYFLEKNYNKMSTTEKIIASYIINNTSEIVGANIHKTAEHLNISSSSISRFVKKYCNMTFNELKISLASINEKESINNTEEMLNWVDCFDTLPTNIINNIVNVCEDILKVNELETFKKAIELIEKADTIYLFGIGASAIIAQDFQLKLIRMQKKCVFNFDSVISRHNTRLITDKDVAIAISFSGETKDTNSELKLAKKRGAKCIAITKNAKTSLEELADLNLVVPSTELNKTRLSAIFSRYGQLFILDMLFLGIARQNTITVESFIDRLNEFFQNEL
ncbi:MULTISPECIES: MurR/RpiR family transcriptional regulator [unclassified Clostridium]|uniref:MurR/RpiR family transcriptional regulator n=1 Tax=unclassified Clostridium TaxID=2614128 RepID=UPI0025D0996A|nr:MurR/RpiR family transcriptional regulator [Clostridium sp.]MCI6693067.1 MurR/RpiR family transcriptional regulator [Clostridium sp.]MDY2632340.1 MurR/RpiR family transcriptional regulator [Clostridium sp.]MDY4252969.1 MurR/RpiR family transcriptional regulator [Clostridium sp.]MDY6226878.1 MurR/RpiR family transcriptional regulator [Clostridium sp.]